MVKASIKVATVNNVTKIANNKNNLMSVKCLTRCFEIIQPTV